MKPQDRLSNFHKLVVSRRNSKKTKKKIQLDVPHPVLLSNLLTDCFCVLTIKWRITCDLFYNCFYFILRTHDKEIDDPPPLVTVFLSWLNFCRNRINVYKIFMILLLWWLFFCLQELSGLIGRKKFRLRIETVLFNTLGQILRAVLLKLKTLKATKQKVLKFWWLSVGLRTFVKVTR